PSPGFALGLAVRVSRSRWYRFMRKVFHYQNGSGSDLGPNPFDSKNWMLMEFIALTVQISLIAYTLMISKAEKPAWPMRIWSSGYAVACSLSILLLYCRYSLVHHRTPENDSTDSDIEQQTNGDEQQSRNQPLVNRFKTWLELLFAVWFVTGNVWMFDSRFGSYHRAPKLHLLCISILAWNAVSYSFPFLLFLLLCCCVPLLSTLVGYNINTGSPARGASDEVLAALPSWKLNGVVGGASKNQVSHRNPNLNDWGECCICLAKYRVKEEIRQLPCLHVFHLNCVDQWLRIISCCPLCKQGIQK
ncbi:hypothetical protein M569_16836, partial [Genlisea aurea]